MSLSSANVVVSYLLLCLNLKLSAAKLLNFSGIWRAIDTIMYLLKQKGEGGGKSVGLFYCLILSNDEIFNGILQISIMHKVRINKEYHSVCPLVGIGTLPTPLSPASVPLPPEPGGGAHSPAGEGLGESQFRRLEKKVSTLPTLWYHESYPPKHFIWN